MFPVPYRIRCLLIVASLALLASGCHDRAREEDGADYTGFVNFYERFHQDSAFQMAHILFPLQGLPAAGDTTSAPGQPFFWQEENWKMQGPFDADRSEFTRTIKPYGPDIMVEEIVHRNGEIGMMRRWARLDSTWYLVYYAGLNALSR